MLSYFTLITLVPNSIGTLVPFVFGFNRIPLFFASGSLSPFTDPPHSVWAKDWCIHNAAIRPHTAVIPPHTAQWMPQRPPAG